MTKMIKREFEIDITPYEAAEAFTDWDSDDQAAFFDAVGRISSKWPGAGWCQQSYGIVRVVDGGGRNVIQSLADHFASYFDWEPSK